MRVEIRNETKARVRSALLRSVAHRAGRLFRLPAYAHVHIALISDHRMRSVNKRTRGVDQPTDVLAFPLSGRSHLPLRIRDGDGLWRLGDILLSPETARRDARVRGVSLHTALAELAAHGLLHLLGYDHRSRFERARMERLTHQVVGYFRRRHVRRKGQANAHGRRSPARTFHDRSD